MNLEMQAAVIDKYYATRDTYHGAQHIYDMLNGLSTYGYLSSDEQSILQKAIVFHDVVYNSEMIDNEERSCEVYASWCPNDKDAEQVKELIMITKNHVCPSDNKLARIMIDLDLQVLFGTLPELIKYEHAIFKEFQSFDIDEYIDKRVAFLEDMCDKIPRQTLLIDLIDYVRTRQYRIGIYPGSFNPFHIGHKNIVEKAEQVFDKVVIAKGANSDKKNEGVWALPRTLTNQKIEYTGLVSDLFTYTSHNIKKFFIRGFRNVYDIGYEESLRKTIHIVNPSINFVYFFCDREMEHMSSSVIRELIKYPSSEAIARSYIVK